MNERSMHTGRSRWRSWIAVPIGVVGVITGGTIGGSAGMGLVIWLVEGGDVFRELFYPPPGPSEFIFLRGIGLVIGLVIGGSLGGGVALVLLVLGMWKFGLLRTNRMPPRSG